MDLSKSIGGKVSPKDDRGVRGFVQRYQTAYGELEHLGFKHNQQECTDNILKNLLCDSTTSLVELIRASYKHSKERANIYLNTTTNNNGRTTKT
jgi:hypothetical protein